MFQHGDHVEFEEYPGKWVPGTVYVVHRNTVVIMADQPSQLVERSYSQVRKV